MIRKLSRRNLIRLGLVAPLALLPWNNAIANVISGGRALTALPVAFNWPNSTYPVNLVYNGTKWITDFNPDTYAQAALSGPQFFVNVGTGSDANSGLTQALAVKSIFKATQLGNALGVPFCVYVAPGSYPRENNFTTTGTLVPNTQPAAYIATGTGVECWSGTVLTWPGSPDVTFPNTYKVARSNVARVINLTTNDANGDYVELIKVADAATCNATANSWAQVATDLYVHRTSEEAPTTANTRVLLLSTPNLQTGATSKDVYVYGIDFQGGANGAVSIQTAATLNAMFVNCSMKYAGASGNAVNGLAINNITGLVACKNCIAACNQVDGFNIHKTAGSPYLLTIDCVGRNNGRDTNLSCNGLTTHDGALVIDVNGEYYQNYGANVIPINTCQMFCAGTYSHDSFGDVVHGGTTIPTDYQTQNTAEMWLLDCRSSVSTNALVLSDTSIMLTRNFTSGVGQLNVIGAGATLGTF